LEIQVTAIRQKKRATVDSIKGQFGFLDYEVEEGKKLFFHMSEVQGNSYNLYPGDTVEFSIVTNQVVFFSLIGFFLLLY
jgi:cold shock CspA family protein